MRSPKPTDSRMRSRPPCLSALNPPRLILQSLLKIMAANGRHLAAKRAGTGQQIVNGTLPRTSREASRIFLASLLQ